ncbi:MAG TPA: CRTAC1 family protein [Verrucomicrobiae bacterium]|nr:CRTAC1 family protein [Verrucomicrobiae bacterium]
MASPTRRSGPRPALLLITGLLIVAAGGAAAWTLVPRRTSMPDRLRALVAGANPEDNPFMNVARAKRLEEQWTKAGEKAGPAVLFNLSKELLNAGRTNDAIARLDEFEAQMRRHGEPAGSKRWIDLRIQQAISQLRRAEEENCSAHHNPKSCLFPIRGAGVHQVTRGSEAAVRLLLEVLQADPDNLQARWLVNVAAMTLGTWPDGLTEAVRIGPEHFVSDADIGEFNDIAADLGLDVDDLAGGSIAEDFDGDGDLDLMISAMGLQSPLRLFRNNGDGSFTEMSKEAGLEGETGGLNIVETDYDNDGRPDVFVLRGGWMGAGGIYPRSLLHNEGNGTFTDVTEDAGLLAFAPTQTATWFDYDDDGWLDVYVGNESGKDRPHPNELYHNNRNGTFTEVGHASGVDVIGFVKGVTSGDFDNDGRADLFVSNRGGDKKLYHNDGPAPGGGWRFTDVAARAGVNGPLYSFPTWFFDYDNDGWEDLFISGYMIQDAGDIAADVLGLPTRGERLRLYRNKGDGTFADVTHEAHLDHVISTMGSNYGDLDNDGWLDLYLSTGDPNLGTLVPDRVFRNAAGRLFQDVTTSGGFGQLQKGHGVSFADFDNDGDQDIYHVVGGAFETDHFRNAFLLNPGHGNHFLVLKLEGVRANRAAIGARVRVVVSTPAGERSLFRTVRTGGSFGGSPLRQEIGLGDATAVTRVEIGWPGSADLQVITGLEPDRRYVVRQGDPAAKPFTLMPFKLSGAPRS